MKESELNSLIETAKEQLTADYACYFSIRDAEIIIELAKSTTLTEFQQVDSGVC